MALLNSDIEWYLSGGASNSNPNESFGGAISSTLLDDNSLDNLFDSISQPSRDAGATDGNVNGTQDYRVIFLKIKPSASGTGTNGKFWFSMKNSISLVHYRVAIGTINTDFTKPANENTGPIGVSYVAVPSSEGTALSLPDVSPGDRIPIIIQRTIHITNETQTSKGFTMDAKWQTT